MKILKFENCTIFQCRNLKKNNFQNSRILKFENSKIWKIKNFQIENKEKIAFYYYLEIFVSQSPLGGLEGTGLMIGVQQH